MNYLFRGNEPVRGGRFDWNWTVSNLREGAALRNVTLPEKFYLIDFCLLGIEADDIAAEKKFFDENPSKGLFFNWPILGSPLKPSWFGKSLRKQMATKIEGIDKLPETVELLQKYLATSTQDIPVVVLIHCEAGKDRTGEVSGAYYLSGLQWNFKQTNYYDNKCVEGKRDISWFSSNALQWYCWRLYYGGRKELDCSPNGSYVGVCDSGLPPFKNPNSTRTITA